MIFLLTTYLILFGLALLVLMIVQHNRGKIQLISFRNIFLVGTIVFQCSSASVALNSYDPNVPIDTPGYTGFIFCVWLTIYIAIFLFVYSRGWGVKNLGRKIPVPSSDDSSIPLLLMATAMTAVAAVLKFGLLAMGRSGLNVTLAYYLGSMTAVGAGAVACGLLMIGFVRRGFNPAMFIVALGMLCANVLIAIAEAAQRRPVVGVLMGALWGLYYFRFRVMSAWKIAAWVTIIGIGPICLLAMFSTARHVEAVGERSVANHIRNVIEHGNLGEGLVRLGRGQGSGGCSLWLLENYPKNFPYRHMNTFIYFLTYPVPRSVWTTKPYTISQEMPAEANMKGVPIGVFNIGPGIVGQAAAEGGLYALVFYAIWFALMMRLLDEWLLSRLDSPVGVMVLGCALGQVLATPRGEMGSFAAITVLTLLLVLMVIWIPAVLLWPNQTELREHRRRMLGLN